MFLSKELKISGAIGPCVSLKKKGPMVSEIDWAKFDKLMVFRWNGIKNIKFKLI